MLLKDKLHGLQAGSAMWLIVHALAEHGPMTMIELAKHVGLKPDSIRPPLSIQCKNGRLFVVQYRRDNDGGHTYIRALYGLEPPAKKPTKPARFTCSESTRRYRNKKRVKVNSVFALGTPTAERRLRTQFM